MRKSTEKTLLALLLIYGIASLVHFIHNAEFLSDYPGLPASWTRVGVYLIWVGITAIGVLGWLLLQRGYQIAGLLVVVVYAGLGLDSLAHYIVAPMSAHTTMMNVTILLEVAAAGLLLIETARLLAQRVRARTRHINA